jgi:natural product precursor
MTKNKKLSLHRETLRSLDSNQMAHVAGGATQLCIVTRACVTQLCITQLCITQLCITQLCATELCH